MKRTWIGLGLLLVLGTVAGLVAGKEHTLATGRVVLLDLAPADPRSLMQGDYMRLAYRIARDAQTDGWPADGRLVLRMEGDVAELVGLDRGAPLEAGQLWLRYRIRQGDVRLGAESYFFQEGTGEVFAAARYGELRVEPEGDAVLVGLRDAEKRPLRAADRVESAAP